MVGAEVARRLGVRVLEGDLVASIAERLGVPVQEVAGHEQCLASALWSLRYLSSVSGGTAYLFGPLDDDRAYRAAADASIRELAAGGGVFVEHGAAIVLKDRPDALHVRLEGPPELRIRQIGELVGLDARTARHRQRQIDHLHGSYVRHYYHTDVADPRHYDIVLDATSLPLATCVEIIVAGARHLADLAGAGLVVHRLRQAG